MRGCKLTNNFIPVVGTDTTVDLKNNSANIKQVFTLYSDNKPKITPKLITAIQLDLLCKTLIASR